MIGIGIIEVGSTFTKSYIARANEVELISVTDIPLKRHFEERAEVTRSDCELIGACARALHGRVDRVAVYGTSVFRRLNTAQLSQVRESLSAVGVQDFSVVSADQESDFTATGAVDGLDYEGPIGVMVGGGGSTEVSVRQSGQVLARANTGLGVGDVNAAFPDLMKDVATSDPSDVIAWVSERLTPCSVAADLLVLAGGDFPLLYENAGYNLQPNPYTSDAEKASVLLNADKNLRDRALFHALKLNDFRGLTPETPAWWDGTRAMCCIVAAVAAQLKTHWLVPTRISMVHGIAQELRRAAVQDRSLQ